MKRLILFLKCARTNLRGTRIIFLTGCVALGLKSLPISKDFFPQKEKTKTRKQLNLLLPRWNFFANRESFPRVLSILPFIIEINPLCYLFFTVIPHTAKFAHITGLSPWNTYEFRVIASNELGAGEASEPSPKVKTPPRSKYCKTQGNFRRNRVSFFTHVSVIEWLPYWWSCMKASYFKFGFGTIIRRNLRTWSLPYDLPCNNLYACMI